MEREISPLEARRRGQRQRGALRIGWPRWWRYGAPVVFSLATLGLAQPVEAASCGGAGSAFAPASGFAGADQQLGTRLGVLEQRAHNGDAVAMRELGRRYRDGAGVDHDWIEAHKWLNLASSWLKDAGRERDAVAQCLTSEQLYRASLAAAKWLATGAER